MNVWQIPLSVIFLGRRTLSPGSFATYVLSKIQCQPLVKYNMIKGDARELAKAVSYVHTFGFVHKTIRPELILTFSKVDGDLCVFHVGFENFRREYGWTQRRGNEVLDQNLYRHPSRQGAYPREDYLMQHDTYSHGVCLLEIGIWTSLVEYNSRGMCLPTGLLLGVPPGTTDASLFLLTRGQDKLLFLARSSLPQAMGTKYAEIVQTCLTCLEPENGDFGDVREFQDKDGVRVGVRYIEKSLGHQDISVIPDSSGGDGGGDGKGGDGGGDGGGGG
ncbi:hypothetical protein NM208_g13659 [Fusarium decemcellulare]|uniref:Uncharacterized protein n=1 Tax=Fusarium decemcellulare TaxID=57161 RepID=A0ACC1RKY4_9HYPO|nr:hypothetical protein NM208_g13659 [Fusarium decemcellulare]